MFCSERARTRLCWIYTYDSLGYPGVAGVGSDLRLWFCLTWFTCWDITMIASIDGHLMAFVYVRFRDSLELLRILEHEECLAAYYDAFERSYSKVA